MLDPVLMVHSPFTCTIDMKRGSKSDGTQDTFFVFEQTPSTLSQMIDFGYAPYFQCLTPSTLLCKIFAPYSPVLPVENLTLRTGLSRVRRDFGLRLWTPSQSPVKVHATKLCLTIFAFYSLCQGVFRWDVASTCKDRSEGKKEGTLASKSA